MTMNELLLHRVRFGTRDVPVLIGGTLEERDKLMTQEMERHLTAYPDDPSALVEGMHDQLIDLAEWALTVAPLTHVWWTDFPVDAVEAHVVVKRLVERRAVVILECEVWV